MNPHPQPLWTVHDLATYLGVPVMTIYHWRRTGYGVALDDGGRREAN